MKTLYCNGTILTMKPDMPEADYLVSEDDRILAVGTGQYAGDPSLETITRFFGLNLK